MRHDLELNRISVEYRCISGMEIDPICIADWQPVPLCHVNRTERDVFYNCIIRHNRVLLSFKYEIKAAILSSLGWRNQTTSFTVELPSMCLIIFSSVVCRAPFRFVITRYSISILTKGPGSIADPERGPEEISLSLVWCEVNKQLQVLVVTFKGS